MKFKIEMLHPEHGKADTTVECERDKITADGFAACRNDYVAVFAYVINQARKNLASRHVDYESFGSDSAYANRLDEVGKEFDFQDIAIVTDQPMIRYSVSGRYPDNDPWDDWVHGFDEESATFEALFTLAQNSGGDPEHAEDFADTMESCTVDDLQSEPITKGEALAAASKLIAFAEAYSAKMDGDAEGDGARPPTGDDYNELHNAILAMKAELASGLPAA